MKVSRLKCNLLWLFCFLFTFLLSFSLHKVMCTTLLNRGKVNFFFYIDTQLIKHFLLKDQFTDELQ